MTDAVPKMISLPNAERVMFGSAYEALFQRALRKEMTVTLAVELSKCGVNLEKISAGYSYADWLKTLKVTSDVLYPGKPISATYVYLGERLVESFFETLIGKPLIALLRLMGPERTLARMKKNLRSGNNYAETILTKIGPGDFELWVNESDETRFITFGVLRRGMQFVTDVSLKVELLRTDESGTVFTVKF